MFQNTLVPLRQIIPIWVRRGQNVYAVLLYRVIQKKRSIFWEVIVSVTVRQKNHMYICLMLNVYQHRAAW